MIREKLTTEQFYKVAKENDYFIWHFLQKKQNNTGLLMYSIFDENDEIPNTLKNITDNCGIPYFESYTEDSIDFLAGLGFEYEKLFVNDNKHRNVSHESKFRPIVVGFNKFTKVCSTFEVCYCPDGVIEILSRLDSKYIEELMENLNKNPD